MSRRQVTPAEAALLVTPAGRTATKCLQAGLLALLAAGRIGFVKSDGPLKPAEMVLKGATPGTADPLPRHLAVLEASLVDQGKGNRLTAAEVLHALQKRFGHDYRRYLHEEVAPELIRRNLLTRTDGRWLGLFPRITYERTASGDLLSAPLRRLMTAIERLPALLKSDPEQALRLARSAGALLILSPEALRQLPQLRRLFEQGGDDVAVVSILALGGEGDPEWDAVLELSDLAALFDVHGLFASLETVGDFTSGGDSSSSDGGGGDGGGGD
ncbi:MAG: hypothetical protein DCE92_03495 [Alphaproteobacteria bacterium]|nr:MAG: hypothetical protein DCE92_03495 [Alphaproteobacteria bacterium]